MECLGKNSLKLKHILIISLGQEGYSISSFVRQTCRSKLLRESSFGRWQLDHKQRTRDIHGVCIDNSRKVFWSPKSTWSCKNSGFRMITEPTSIRSVCFYKHRLSLYLSFLTVCLLRIMLGLWSVYVSVVGNIFGGNLTFFIMIAVALDPTHFQLVTRLGFCTKGAVYDLSKTFYAALLAALLSQLSTTAVCPLHLFLWFKWRGVGPLSLVASLLLDAAELEIGQIFGLLENYKLIQNLNRKRNPKVIGSIC